MPSPLRDSATTLLRALASAPPALGADGERTPLNLDETPTRVAGQAGTSGGGLVRTIVGLAVVIAVIYGLTWVLRQVKRSGASGTGLAALATLPLGPNRSLHLVRAGDEIVLVGAGEGGVTTIRTYGEAEARALGLLEPVAAGSERLAPAPRPAAGANLLAELRRRTVIR